MKFRGTQRQGLSWLPLQECCKWLCMEGNGLAGSRQGLRQAVPGLARWEAAWGRRSKVFLSNASLDELCRFLEHSSMGPGRVA